jgi:hypothetical protein
MMVNFKLQRQYKQRNRGNKHQDYRRFTPFTKSFDRFKRGSPALRYTNTPCFELREPTYYRMAPPIADWFSSSMPSTCAGIDKYTFYLDFKGVFSSTPKVSELDITY